MLCWHNIPSLLPSFPLTVHDWPFHEHAMLPLQLRLQVNGGRWEWKHGTGCKDGVWVEVKFLSNMNRVRPSWVSFLLWLIHLLLLPSPAVTSIFLFPLHYYSLPSPPTIFYFTFSCLYYLSFLLSTTTLYLLLQYYFSSYCYFLPPNPPSLTTSHIQSDSFALEIQLMHLPTITILLLTVFFPFCY